MIETISQIFSIPNTKWIYFQVLLSFITQPFLQIVVGLIQSMIHLDNILHNKQIIIDMFTQYGDTLFDGLARHYINMTSLFCRKFYCLCTRHWVTGLPLRGSHKGSRYPSIIQCSITLILQQLGNSHLHAQTQVYCML